MRSQGSYNLQLPRREMTQLGVFHYRSEFPFAAPEGSKHLSEGHQSVLNGSCYSTLVAPHLHTHTWIVPRRSYHKPLATDLRVLAACCTFAGLHIKESFITSKVSSLARISSVASDFATLDVVELSIIVRLSFSDCSRYLKGLF